MRKNWKIHIKFGVYKSKRLEWVWSVLVWKKVRTLYYRKLPNEEKSDIKTYQNSQICYERETSSEDFQEVHTTSWKWKSSGRLPGSFLAHYILDE